MNGNNPVHSGSGNYHSLDNQQKVTAAKGIGLHLKILVGVMCFFLFTMESWAACKTTGYGPDNGSYYSGSSCEEKLANGNIVCKQFLHCTSSSTCQYGNGYFYDRAWNCSLQGWGGTRARDCLVCDTKAEADSLNCVNAGSSWKDGQCKQDDGTREKAEAERDSLYKACTDEHAGPRYSIACDSEGQNCYVTGYCNYCNKDENGNYASDRAKKGIKEASEDCCITEKHAPPTSFKCDNSTAMNPAQLGGKSILSWDNCNTLAGVDVSTGVISGCEDYVVTSSSGEGGSESSSSEVPRSCSSVSDAEVGQVLVNGLDDIKDTLHKMLQMDTILSQNDTMLHNDLWSIVKELQQDKKDTFVVNVQGDTIIVNPPDVNFHPTIQGDTIIVNNEGIDSLRNDLKRGDSLSGIRWDSLFSAIRGLVGNDSGSAVGYNDSNLIAILTASDTTGADTAGKGETLDSLRGVLDGMDSGKVEGNIFNSCDTTGGKTCDTQYIGQGGLDSAVQGYGQTIRVYGDSIRNGQVGDSLNAWIDGLKSDKLQGGGSASCPSVLTRTWNVPIGNITSVELGPLGRYMCADILGGITPWAFIRIMLRAVTAIICMWWLFHQATGTGGGNDDD